MDQTIHLKLATGSWAVLISPTGVQTAATDYSGTTRSSSCSPSALISFATAVLDYYAVGESLDAQIRS